MHKSETQGAILMTMADSSSPLDRSQAFNRKIVFLSGLPRTGSTLLTSILNQNPDVYAGGSSPLVFLMLGAYDTCETIASDTLQRTRRESFRDEWVRSIPNLFYKEIQNPVVVDKNRAWSRDHLGLRYYVADDPKILVMLRPITEIVRSFVFVAKERGDILPERGLLTDSCPLLLNIKNTAWALSHADSSFLFVTYDQLVNKTQFFLQEVSKFWGLSQFNYDLENIKDEKPENDAALATQGLHEIRTRIGKRNYEVKVSRGLMDYAKELDEALWHDYEQAKKQNRACFLD